MGPVVATDIATAGDLAAADSITRYIISGGADRSLFTLDADTGALSFSTAPNFEDPQGGSGNDVNTYELIVEVSSGAGPRELTDTATIMVEVVNDDDDTEAPSAPATPTVTAGFTSVMVTWTEPANMGPAITGYTVEYRLASSSGEWSDAGHTGTNPTATITGLASNTLYAVRVRASNPEGDGTFSSVGQIRTLEVTVTAPLDSSTSLSVTWEAEASATRYIVRYRQGRTEPYTSVPAGAVDSVARTATITGLTPGTSYQVQVSAADGVNSDFSPPMLVTTNREVDTDSDGLIDIRTLAELNNIRNDLAGASYKDTSGGSGLTTGCPDEGCVGYELMNSLNFAGADNDPATTNDNYDTDNNDSNGNWMPIGSASNPFTGTFEGNGYTISNLSVILPSQNEIGLFGRTMNSTTIRNVGLTAVSLQGNMMVGGLAGNNSGTISGSYVMGSVTGGVHTGGLVGRNTGTGTISGSYVTGSVTGGDTGGLVGDNDGTISNSYVIGSVMGSNGVGGLVGNNGGNSGSISNSYVIGSVMGSNFVGGLVGYNTRTISNSYATGSVSGGDHIGGLVGFNETGRAYQGTTFAGFTRNSYAIGVVTGTGSNVGGLIGSNRGTSSTGIAADSYWNTETSRQSMSEGGAGVTGRTTLQLVAPISAADFDAQWPTAVWDFGSNRQYPGLQLPLSTADCTVSAGTPMCTHRPADPDPTARISADPTTITEGAVATFTVTLDLTAPAGGVTVRVGVTQSGSYISGSAPTTVVIAVGATTGTLMVRTTDDTTDEPAGSITATINAGTSYTVGTGNTARVTVNDNDEPNRPPTAEAGPAQDAQAGATFGLLGTATDQDNDSLSYSWTWTQTAGDTSVVLAGFDTDTLSPTFTVPDDAPVRTTFTFTLTVTDEDEASTVSSPVDVVLVAGVDQTGTRDGSNVLPSLTIEAPEPPAGEPAVVYIQKITETPDSGPLATAFAVAVARPLSARRFVRDETIYDISLTTLTQGSTEEAALTSETQPTSRTVCLPISRQAYNALNGNLRVNRNITIFHFTDGNWNRLESTINGDRTAICANPPSLSPFVIGYVLPEDRQSDTSILLPITGGITPPWWLTLTLVLTGAGSLLLGFSLLLRGRVLGRVRSYTRSS